MEKQTGKSGKEKPRFVGAEKNWLAGSENKPVARMPPVRRLGIVAVEFELLAIRVQVEDVRIAIAVGYICDAIFTTAQAIHQTQKALGWILFGI